MVSPVSSAMRAIASRAAAWSATRSQRVTAMLARLPWTSGQQEVEVLVELCRRGDEQHLVRVSERLQRETHDVGIGGAVQPRRVDENAVGGRVLAAGHGGAAEVHAPRRLARQGTDEDGLADARASEEQRGREAPRRRCHVAFSTHRTRRSRRGRRGTTPPSGGRQRPPSVSIPRRWAIALATTAKRWRNL